jgi:hypothetical protein
VAPLAARRCTSSSVSHYPNQNRAVIGWLATEHPWTIVLDCPHPFRTLPEPSEAVATEHGGKQVLRQAFRQLEQEMPERAGSGMRWLRHPASR